MIKRSFLLFFVFTYNFIFSQFINPKFENFDAIDGISSSTCFEIFQDSEGFLWFGTIDGLNKYDGYEFEIFRSIIDDSESISNNRINAIIEDHKGNLWIGTNNGLNFYNKNSNKFTRINLYHQSATFKGPQKIINDLLFDDKTNELWVATNDNGVIKLLFTDKEPYAENFKISYYAHNQLNNNSLDDNSANVILKDEDNNIWVGTNGQHLNYYNTVKDNFDRVLIENKFDYELNHIPKDVYIDADGDFWIGNDLSNFVIWNKNKNTFKHVSLVEKSIPYTDFYQDKNGLFWVATDGDGLFLFSKEEKEIKQHLTHNYSDPFSLPNNKPSKIYEDRDGMFWIGSYDKGVSKLDPANYSFDHYYYQPNNPKGLNEKIIQSVFQDSQQRIWLGAYNGGLNLFNEEEKTFKHFEQSSDSNSLSSNKILYTFESSDGFIWVCTLDGGLNKFNPETNKFKVFLHDTKDSLSIGQSSVWSGVEDSKKRIWLGLRTEGISLYNPTTENFTNYSNVYGQENGLLSNDIICVFIDAKNRLLVGTSLGLNFLDLNTLETDIPEKLQFSQVEEKGVVGSGINHIAEDHSGNIWLSTDSGVFKLNSNLKLEKSYSSIDGLPNDLVVGIIEDNDANIWITTKGGLSKLNPNTGQFKNFNTHDGLQGAEFQRKSITKTKDGRILVGGINGFNIFQPKNIQIQPSKILTPQLTRLKLNNKPVIVGDTINGRVLLNKTISKTQEIELKHNENYISFEFVALYYEYPEQVQYAYRMKGLDDDFITIGSNRQVNLSNLESGDYTFEVKASVDGKWSEATTASVVINILPPIWKTWWAYIIYLIIGSLLLWVAVHYYTLKVKEAQEHELDQMNLQFFVNVSHEFRTPLTLIMNPVDKILSNFTNNPDITRNSAVTIQRSARRLLHLVNQLLDYRKMDVGMAPLQLESGDIVKFSQDIFSLFKDLAKKKEISYTFSTSESNITSLFDFDKVEKIITNLISNAIKFTNNGGEISVSINKKSENTKHSKFLLFKQEDSNNYLEIVVEDTGVGLNKEQAKNIFSRFYNLDITKTGTGIGLNFTKALVEVHGGTIAVESEYKKGCKFIVKLPLDINAKPEIVENIKNEFLINSMKAVEYDMLISDETALDTKTEAKQDGDKKLPTLLIVEDNKELRIHLTNDLKSSFIVKEAVNGEEGLKKVKKFHPDIVVSDVMMPKMDGFEMCNNIKTELETCHIPVILLTARTLEEDRVEGYENGADAYISKPFVTSVLKARINNLLESKKRLREKFSKLGAILPSSELVSNSLDEVFLEKLTNIIIENISDVDFKQERLFKEMNIGRSQLYRKINSLTGNNPSHFIRTVRLKYASELLQKGGYSIKEITHMSGFNSTAYFSKTFRELFEVTPSQFMENHKKESGE